MAMTVYNQHPDIKLWSPVCFFNRGTYYEYPVKSADIVTMMKIGLRFKFDQDETGGILMYKMQRKENAKPNHQSTTDTISAKAVEDASKMMRLLVAWKIERSGKSKVHIMLVEHDSELVLNEAKLAQLYNKIDDEFSRHYDFSRSTWLVSNNIVLETTYEVVQEEDFALQVTISKGVDDQSAIPTLWIDSERQVSSLMVI
jgi:hypothetical protein